MKEWQNQFNPFNSMKALYHKDHLEACAKGEYLTPVCVSIDPTNKCNFDCIFCNSFKAVSGGNDTMSEEHMVKLADFLGEWGSDKPEGHIKAAYITGGGEPLMNPGTMALIEQLKHNQIQSAVITNGTYLTDEKIDIIVKNCRWIGFSVDAVTNETYNKMKGLPNNSKVFDLVINNIRKIVKRSNELNTGCDVCFKFLLHPVNMSEVYEAACLARSIGVKDFHLRPIRYINFDKIDEKTINFKDNIEYINKQFDEVQTLNTNSFHVYGVRHKFNPDLSIKKNFSKCRIIPIEPTFGADGNVHTCFDHRSQENMILCSHYPDVTEIAKVWNTQKHKDIVNNINVEQCPSCTLSSLNEAIEKVILKDNMCINFL